MGQMTHCIRQQQTGQIETGALLDTRIPITTRT